MEELKTASRVFSETMEILDEIKKDYPLVFRDIWLRMTDSVLSTKRTADESDRLIDDLLGNVAFMGLAELLICAMGTLCKYPHSIHAAARRRIYERLKESPECGLRGFDRWIDVIVASIGMSGYEPAGQTVVSQTDIAPSVLDDAVQVVDDPVRAEDDPEQVQIGGDHYKKYKIQPMYFCHVNGIPKTEGDAICYTIRWRDKGGIADIDKAIHTLQLLRKFAIEEGFPENGGTK